MTIGPYYTTEKCLAINRSELITSFAVSRCVSLNSSACNYCNVYSVSAYVFLSCLTYACIWMNFIFSQFHVLHKALFRETLGIPLPIVPAYLRIRLFRWISYGSLIKQTAFIMHYQVYYTARYFLTYTILPPNKTNFISIPILFKGGNQWTLRRWFTFNFKHFKLRSH
jgi:hypothetical protein